MACGCLDKENDEKIIAEVKRRKGNSEKYSNPRELEITTFENNLIDVINVLPLHRIMCVVKIADNVWEVSLIPEHSDISE